jgi:hypothetical protein
MKFIPLLLSIIFFASCASGKEKAFTGSTPVGNSVRSFLSIPLSDSIDFCRWKLFLDDEGYRLECNYGISKANTNGFIDGGKRIQMSGTFKRDKNIISIVHRTKILKLIELNTDLLHLLDEENRMLTGNAGWSYTLSNLRPVRMNASGMPVFETALKDSMVFTGRTPCPGIDERNSCYKLKWSFVLYSNAKTGAPSTCRIRGTFNDHVWQTGSLDIINKNGRPLYRLQVPGKEPIYFLQPSENILVFTDADAKLLVGNEDFSYTINRIY